MPRCPVERTSRRQVRAESDTSNRIDPLLKFHLPCFWIPSAYSGDFERNQRPGQIGHTTCPPVLNFTLITTPRKVRDPD